MKHIYYYVPPCPLCGSPRTGRYMKLHRVMGSEYTERESLKNGEIVRFEETVPYRNVFCEECGYEWHYNVVGKLMDSEAIRNEKHARQTGERYEELKQDKPRRSWLHKLIRGIV